MNESTTALDKLKAAGVEPYTDAEVDALAASLSGAIQPGQPLPGAEEFTIGRLIATLLEKSAACLELVPIELLSSTEKLWALHVVGPDDVIAMPNEATARRAAAGLEGREKDPPYWGEVIEWPHASDSHAREVIGGAWRDFGPEEVAKCKL